MLNIPDFNDCGKSICEKKDVKYKVLIHGSKLTLYNDLHSTNPFVTVETKKNKIGNVETKTYVLYTYIVK